MFIFSKGAPKTANIIQVPTQTPGKVYRVKRNNNTSNGNGAVNTKDKIYTMKDTKNKGNIWILSSVNTKEYRNHPAAFSEELAHDHIISWSAERDVIYDPFMGSGTVAAVAKRTNRQFIGSEISKEYCDIITKRLLE
jgi:site-specific DNA-methyltransferase (adenine-specific)